MKKAIKKKTLKSIKQLKHEAMTRDYHADIGTVSKLTKKLGDGMMFASTVAEAAGQPEISAPLAIAGGGTLLTNVGLHKLHRSKLLKPLKKRK